MNSISVYNCKNVTDAVRSMVRPTCRVNVGTIEEVYGDDDDDDNDVDNSDDDDNDG